MAASGQQLADENVRLFAAWQAEKSDADYREMVIRGGLSRTEIAKECGFAKSVLAQNPRVKEALHVLETALRARGVLAPMTVASGTGGAPAVSSGSATGGRMDQERLRRLEQENALLRAEVAELRSVLSKQLVLKEALALSGRLPR
ncbi:MAG: hypothetical protein B7Z52_07305 [Burkholderiales bacterium 12-64-5]|nr:MAG: hypothetical protein B7Z52_07305 [Burkholderiales bacterium 12-64-5]